MIGDTIDVDIQGAINAGMTSFCYHAGVVTDIKPTYTVTSLKDWKKYFERSCSQIGDYRYV